MGIFTVLAAHLGRAHFSSLSSQPFSGGDGMGVVADTDETSFDLREALIYGLFVYSFVV
jgi:hypothetical protein